MSDTAARLLRLLSLLQTPREWPGSELAARLEVSPRTVRRDVERLRDLGYPEEATMGALGGYRLVAGTAMPPLLLDDDEAVAIAVGLRAAAGLAVSGIEGASIRALAKLSQVLPARLRHRVTAMGTATQPLLAWAEPNVDPETLVALGSAIANRERVRFRYRAAAGAESRRLVEPINLVARRPPLVPCCLRQRPRRLALLPGRSHPPAGADGSRFHPRELPDVDAATYVARQLGSLVPTYRAVATLQMPAAPAAAILGEAAAELEATGETSCRLVTHADTLAWLAIRLILMGCEFTVDEPPELRAYLRDLAARASHAAGVPTDRPPG